MIILFRFGLGRFTTEEEVDYVADKLINVVTRLREMSPLYELAKEGVDLSTFDLTGGVDYYSLPNLVATMRTSKYSLVQEVMDTRLLKLSDVFREAA